MSGEQCVYTIEKIANLDQASFTSEIEQRLSHRLSYFPISQEQIRAWQIEAIWIHGLAVALKATHPKAQIIFEYAPPHVSGRPDIVMISGNYVFVIEVKTGLERTDKQAEIQSLTYAKNIWNHVRACRDKIVIPVLLQNTKSLSFDLPIDSTDPETLGVYNLSIQSLIDLIKSSPNVTTSENFDKWVYAPRPSITQAAVALMGSLADPAVTTGLADYEEIARLSTQIANETLEDHKKGRHSVVLIVGKPGAGKTLVGLRLAHDRNLNSIMNVDGEPPLFLSGNPSLVNVLTEVLARDENTRSGKSLRESREIASAKILLLHKLVSDDLHIATNVVVFDEGQRVWDAERMKSYHGSGSVGSEAEEILKKLESHPWATLIVLCGTGQEINRGESGLDTWIRAVETRNPVAKHKWRLSGPTELKEATKELDFPLNPATDLIINDSYSLQVVHRAENASQIGDWVNSLLEVKIDEANKYRGQFADFPLVVTRDLETARVWLTEKRDRGERAGLTISALSQRMSIYGLDIKHGAGSVHPWVNWFLDDKPNLHSSQFLEVPASEFQCQGLELDWVGVCWSWDLVIENNKWTGRRLRREKSTWSNLKKNKEYRINAYRVLLTRSRKGMVIWVPVGDDKDKSRSVKEMDDVYRLLVKAGCDEI
jgi:DUF2075 family protein